MDVRKATSTGCSGTQRGKTDGGRLPEAAARRGQRSAAAPPTPPPLLLLLLLLLLTGAVQPGLVLSQPQDGFPDCDGVEGSGKRLDKCGLCGGLDFGCKVMSGLFAPEDVGRGYVDVASIPKGAVNINITERTPSRNYLVLLYKDSQKAIVNGDWTLSWSGDYAAAGTVFSYDRPREGKGESILARGPLTEDVQLQMLSQAKNPGITYEYAIPLAKLYDSALQPAVAAAVADASDSEAAQLLQDAAAAAAAAAQQSAGQRDAAAGTPLRLAEKWDAKERAPVPGEPLVGPVYVDDRQAYDGYGARGTGRAGPNGGTDAHWSAAGRRKPAYADAGADGAERFQWRVSESLTACSATCGEGTQEQKVLCVKTPTMVATSEERCSNLVRPEAPKIRCSLQLCKARWEVSEWSGCSATCGRGTQSRVVECRRETSPGYSAATAPSACGAKKPSAQQTCRSSPCYAWRAGNWSDCSASCGAGGERSRSVACEDASGAAVDDALCAGTRPRAKEACRTPCAGAWFYTEWDDQCSADCSEGHLTRRVHCVASGGGSSPAMASADGDDASACSASAKPDAKQQCKGSELCKPGRWFAGQWGECAGACAEGEQRRDVVCLRKVGYWQSPTHDADCQPHTKPSGVRKCRPRACEAESVGEWFVSEYSACSATCDAGIRRREVRCLPRDGSGSAQCDESTKPKETQSCEMSACASGPSCVDKHVVCKAASDVGLCQLVQYASLCCASCTGRA